MTKVLRGTIPTTLALVAILTLLLTGSVSAVGSTYYVSQAGSGTACSSVAPCSFATGQGKLVPGDTLQIVGTLTAATTFSKSGTVTDPITYHGGAIDGPHTIQSALTVTGSHLVIQNLDVQGGQSFGIRVGTSTTSPNDLLFEGVSVHDSVWENRSGASCIGGTGGWGRGFTMAMTSYNITIRNSTIYDNCGEGLAFTQGHDVYVQNVTAYDNFSRNIYIGNAYNIVLDQVTTYCADPNFFRNGNPARGIGLAIETTNYSIVGNQLHDVTIQNSVIRDCQGINLYVEVSGQEAKDVLVAGNTFYNVPAPQVDIPGTNIVVRDNLVDPTATSAVTATSTPSATPTSTPTFTFTPSPTASSTSTATPTPDVCEGGRRIFEDAEYIICAFTK